MANNRAHDPDRSPIYTLMFRILPPGKALWGGWRVASMSRIRSKATKVSFEVEPVSDFIALKWLMWNTRFGLYPGKGTFSSKVDLELFQDLHEEARAERIEHDILTGVKHIEGIRDDVWINPIFLEVIPSIKKEVDERVKAGSKGTGKGR